MQTKWPSFVSDHNCTFTVKHGEWFDKRDKFLVYKNGTDTMFIIKDENGNITYKFQRLTRSERVERQHYDPLKIYMADNILPINSNEEYLNKKKWFNDLGGLDNLIENNRLTMEDKRLIVKFYTQPALTFEMFNPVVVDTEYDAFDGVSNKWTRKKVSVSVF